MNSLAGTLGRAAAPAETRPPGSLSPRGLGWTGPLGDQPRRPAPVALPSHLSAFHSRGRVEKAGEATSGRDGRREGGRPPGPGTSPHLRGRAELAEVRGLRGRCRATAGPQERGGPPSCYRQAVQASTQTWPAGRDRGLCQCRPERGLLAWVTGSLGLGGVLLSLWAGVGGVARIRRECFTFAKALSPQGAGRSPARGAHRDPL